MEEKMIEDWRRLKLVSSSQLATIMELAQADSSPTQSTDRQQSVDVAEYEPTNTQRAEVYEFELEDEPA